MDGTETSQQQLSDESGGTLPGGAMAVDGCHHGHPSDLP